MPLDKFFYPKSIALVGASKKEGKVGYTLIKKLSKFQGKKYFINIEGYTINNVKTYKGLSEIKESIDLLIIAVPAFTIKQVMMEAAYKKIKNIIIISAGFAEVSDIKLEKEILLIAKDNNMRILGPNNFGIANTSNDLDCTFSRLTPKKGSIAFASQSGVLWSALSDYSWTENFGFSKFINFGDMIDIDITEVIDYLNKDKETKAIFLYIESLTYGKEFMRSVSKSNKPIIVIKAGREKGDFAETHTGSIVSSYEIYRAACMQSGAIFVNYLDEALDIIKFLDIAEKPKSSKTVVISNGRGPGELLSDYLALSSINLVKTPKNIKFSLPDNSYTENPIDILGEAKADRFAEVLKKIKSHNFYDILIAVLTPQDITQDTQIAAELIKFKKETKKTVIACFMGPKSFKETKNMLENHKIPVFCDISRVGKLIKNIT